MYAIRYYREMMYLVSELSLADFDRAHEEGQGAKMLYLAELVIDTHEKSIIKSRSF
jgi:hypothetical protein